MGRLDLLRLDRHDLADGRDDRRSVERGVLQAAAQPDEGQLPLHAAQRHIEVLGSQPRLASLVAQLEIVGSAFLRVEI